MRRLPEVEQAKGLMNEAMTWSVMKWLSEKKRVRKAADQANAALDRLDQEVKAGWSPEVRVAYQQLGEAGKGKTDGQAGLIAKKIKEADDEAYGARMEAEKTFDEAERRLSTSMARDGCRKAIHSWELHERAIAKAEAVKK